MSNHRQLTFLLVMAATHGLYAESFLKELKRQGHRVLVLTRAEALTAYEWPREAIDGLYAVRDIFDRTELKNAVTYLAREVRIDRLIGPGEYDIELAAELREHLRIPGMGASRSRFFRDKLAMREQAHSQGVRVPPFVGAIHRPTIARYMQEIPGPWVLKPRMEASSKGIQLLHHPEAVWQAIDELADRASDYLLEAYIPGDVFHVDAVVVDRQVRFAAAHQYGKPIFDLHRHGGVYTTSRVARGSHEEAALLEMNETVIAALGLKDGVTHIEYIRSRESGRFYFLEAGARVGSGMIEEMVEAESGVNLWREWARIEIAQGLGVPYELPSVHHEHAGVLATVTPYERPDGSAYLGPGVVQVPIKPYHLGLLVRGQDAEAVRTRLAHLAERIGRELMAHL